MYKKVRKGMQISECEDCGFQCSLDGSRQSYIREVEYNHKGLPEVKDVCIDCAKNYNKTEVENEQG